MQIENKEIISSHYERRVALGVFDGAHLGHQKLMESASLVMTFNPHPQVVTHPYKDNIQLLTTLDEKQSLIPNLIVLQFTVETANLSSEEFVRDILVKELGVDTVITGYDYLFGKGRTGNTELLAEYGEKYGFNVQIVDKVELDGVAVKSSYIRKLIAAGDVERAAVFLGRDYFMFGQVVHGKGLGRTLGFATVNVMVAPEKLVPRLGVYGGRIIIDGHIYNCAINVGLVSRDLPADDSTNIVVEAHLFDFDSNVYGKKVELYFSFFYREQELFESLDDLKEQIAKDVVVIKERLRSVNKL